MKKHSERSVFRVLSPVAALLCVCTVSAALLAGASEITREPINEAQRQTQLASMMAVLPPETADCEKMSIPDSSAECFRAVDRDGKTIAYAVSSSAGGYGGRISVMTGIGTDGCVLAVSVYDNSTETPGLGAKTSEPEFTSQFAVNKAVPGFCVTKDAPVNDGFETIDAVTGATISSRAVASCVTHAVEVYKQATEENDE